VNPAPQPGDRYRHFKGGIYTIVCIAKHSGTEQDLVVYESESSGRWVRPLDDFEEIITRDVPCTDPACAYGAPGHLMEKTFPRFQRLTDEKPRV
jgi:hypothetical protein